MLARFRKTGGFIQLLQLIETCEPAKQKNLFHLVATEDPGWAVLIKQKSLSFEKIVEWPLDVFFELTPHLPDRILAVCIARTPAHHQEKWWTAIDQKRVKEIETSLKTMPANPEEKIAAGIKLIQLVRELQSQGVLKFDEFAPALVIDQRIAA